MQLGLAIGSALGYYFLFGLVILNPILALIFLVFHKKIYGSLWKPNQGSQEKWPFRMVRFLEFVFGFLNPALYLLFIFPALWDLNLLPWRMFHIVSLMFFGGFWAFRISKPSMVQSLHPMTPTKVASIMAILFILAHSIAILSLDGVILYQAQTIVPALLYITPILIALQYIFFSSFHGAEKTLGIHNLFYFRNLKGERSMLDRVYALGLTMGCLLIAFLPLVKSVNGSFFSEKDAAREFITEHKAQIEQAAQAHDLDPKALASILYVAQIETAPWKPGFEKLVSGIWLWDEHGHFYLNRSMNLSIGRAQIKPLTAQSAIYLYYLKYYTKVSSKQNHSSEESQKEPDTEGPNNKSKMETMKFLREIEVINYKEFRGAWAGNDSWNMTLDDWAKISPPFSTFPSRSELVRALESEEGSIKYCAFILGLFSVHWASHPLAPSLRERPEILATLYQLGFERSNPHPDPSPSNFGKKVLLAISQDWLIKTFL